ncbi:WYL domain-containing protein [Synechococcales cyanobacterium C]|uniref:WYL domain-containing protein n=1 Tax=Petrachloros mirabilis ULC683 TaxID=2781853 RepID=A0A8K1ZZL4_9CYAN|nr:WYL domain-containing protein [Petrachloros mirabilis ULC683]
MPRKKETLTLSVPPGTKEKLDEIAAQLGFYWGKSPSSSALIAAIAAHDIHVEAPLIISSGLREALCQAVKHLRDAGQIELAKSVITLLLTYGQLAPPLRQSLIQQVSSPTEGWRLEIEAYIQHQQPFLLLYKDAQGQALELTVRHGEICFYERRFYLQTWCDQGLQSANLPELRHNRCLRFDRIQGVLSTQGSWRGEFDTVKVKLHFKGVLAQSYEPKPQDLSQHLENGILCVERLVVNDFWLVREVLRYGANCEILDPKAMRDLIHKELLALLETYRG